ncbi:TPA: protein kinase family protein [Candidatus Woesearchaeota archaeon]|nr:protein kinase family protein [Candidatus Woesearchaeota archaeon]
MAIDDKVKEGERAPRNSLSQRDRSRVLNEVQRFRVMRDLIGLYRMSLDKCACSRINALDAREVIIQGLEAYLSCDERFELVFSQDIESFKDDMLGKEYVLIEAPDIDHLKFPAVTRELRYKRKDGKKGYNSVLYRGARFLCEDERILEGVEPRMFRVLERVAYDREQLDRATVIRHAIRILLPEHHISWRPGEVRCESHIYDYDRHFSKMEQHIIIPKDKEQSGFLAHELATEGEDPKESASTIRWLLDSTYSGSPRHDEIRKKRITKSLESLASILVRDQVVPGSGKEWEVLEEHINSACIPHEVQLGSIVYEMTRFCFRAFTFTDIGLVHFSFMEEYGSQSISARPYNDLPRIKEVISHDHIKGIEQAVELSEMDIPNYLILGEMPSQGMTSKVYIAEDQRVGKTKVALKIMKPEDEKHARLRKLEEKGASSVRKMFENELAQLQRLRHPNIADIRDFGDYRGRLFITQRYYELGSLEDNLTTVDFKSTLLAILRGMSFLHSLGRVHRDLKPANIFMTGDDDVAVVGDLQTCRRVEDLQPHKVGEDIYEGYGLTHGLSRAAPEVIERHSYDQAADVYGIGMLIWSMMTGKDYLRPLTSEETEGKSKAEIQRMWNEKVFHSLKDQASHVDLPSKQYNRVGELATHCLAYYREYRIPDATQVMTIAESIFEPPEKTVERLIERYGHDHEVMELLVKIYNQQKATFQQPPTFPINPFEPIKGRKK